MRAAFRRGRRPVFAGGGPARRRAACKRAKVETSSAQQVRYALPTTQRPTTPATTWVTSHCTRIRPTAYGRRTDGSFALYD